MLLNQGAEKLPFKDSRIATSKRFKINLLSRGLEPFNNKYE